MNIAIIGSSGYIGSYLYDLISQQYTVKGYDIKPSTRTDIVIKGGDISEETLRLHDIIIYLGGLSGRKQCWINWSNLQSVSHAFSWNDCKEMEGAIPHPGSRACFEWDHGHR